MCVTCAERTARAGRADCFRCHVRGLTVMVPAYMRATHDTAERARNEAQIRARVAADPDRYSNATRKELI